MTEREGGTGSDAERDPLAHLAAELLSSANDVDNALQDEEALDWLQAYHRWQRLTRAWRPSGTTASGCGWPRRRSDCPPLCDRRRTAICSGTGCRPRPTRSRSVRSAITESLAFRELTGYQIPELLNALGYRPPPPANDWTDKGQAPARTLLTVRGPGSRRSKWLRRGRNCASSCGALTVSAPKPSRVKAPRTSHRINRREHG